MGEQIGGLVATLILAIVFVGTIVSVVGQMLHR